MKYLPGSYFRSIIFLTIIICLPFERILGQTTPSTYLIYNARIVDVVKGSLRSENSVLIEGGLIKAIGEYASLSKNVPSELIDAGNGFLFPIVDMHST
jgi:imidazolonepropionase-like amidohydrolase